MKIRQTAKEINFIESVDYANSFDEQAKQSRVSNTEKMTNAVSMYCVWNFPFIRSYVRGTKRLFLRRKRND
ncbi:hypothetical protein [Bacillus velezensis]|uniref:hypothetical protein n=1 Tax=Bacillus velezensis TaxID=492670 RepID=UPI003D7F2E65